MLSDRERRFLAERRVAHLATTDAQAGEDFFAEMSSEVA